VLIGRRLGGMGGPGKSGLRAVASVASFALSTALTLSIPLLAINARVAQNVFPQGEIDLQAAGRMPNITVLAQDGEKLGSRGSDLGEPVVLSELPPYVIDAFLATEDRRFYDHPGFDLGALVRAAMINYSAGRVRQGGSTITQQLVKNLFLSGEQTLERKFEELHLALWLEARLTKDEILALYLNRIYLGANTYGLNAASAAYFSKPASQLTLNEAALLAGLPKAPSELAPHVNFQGAIERSREVVANLVEAHRIDELTAKMAQMVPPDLALQEMRGGNGYFLDHVAVELKRLLPELATDVVVETTLRADLQDAAETAVESVLDETAFARGAEQAALIAYDFDGGVLAMVGGRSYSESQFNRATQAKRQPGSAFKPFVYLTALEAGFDTETVLADGPVSVDGWAPTNYRETHLGGHRMREALARSSNTATVQVTEAVGREEIIHTARRLGLTSTIRPHPSLALGSFEVALNELTAAYLPIANRGYAPPPYTIERVRTRSGAVLYERPAGEPMRVISERTAEHMAGLLASVVETGTGRGAKIADHEVAGKTGTTNDWRDAWFVGFSAHVAAGVWVGNDAYTDMDEVSGATYPAEIWRAFMSAAHADPALPAIPVGDQMPALDPSLTELKRSYAALYDDLLAMSYGTMPTPYQEPSRRDGIRGILSRQGVIGRVIRREPDGG
jgi:penicillin-binding protein 1A